MNATKITIEAVIASDRKDVWDSWTNPEHIVNWNFASDDWHCPSAENNLQKGGLYKARMEAKDGSFGFDFQAVYDEIVDQERILYTIADGRKVDTVFEDLGDHQTKVTTVFEAEQMNPAEMQRNGWQAILDNFKKYTEQRNSK